MQKNSFMTWVVCAIGLIAVAPKVSADVIDLGAPTPPDFFVANGLGANERGVIFDAINNVSITSAGIKIDPLCTSSCGTPTLGVAIYSGTGFGTAISAGSGWTRTALAGGATVALVDVTAAPAFYDINIAFDFVAGTRYEVVFYALPSPPGFGTSLYNMELQEFDPDKPSYAPFLVAGGALKVYDGSACDDQGTQGPPDCLNASDPNPSSNNNFPHVRLTTGTTVVPEPGTISLLSLVCFGLIGAAARKNRQRKNS